MAGVTKRAEAVIRKADIIAEVLDARFFEETRNERIEKYAGNNGKRLFYVVNKVDLVGGKTIAAIKKALGRVPGTRIVFTSAKDRTGSTRMKEAIGKLAKSSNTEVKVGFVGYPNTGKSSIINLLKGKRVAPASASAGFTKGEKMIRVSQRVMLIDTPGVIPFEERDERKLVLLCAKSPNQVRDVQGCGEEIVRFVMARGKEELEREYDVELAGDEDEEEALEKIAVAKSWLLPGGKPNTDTAARKIMIDWQKGKIKV